MSNVSTNYFVAIIHADLKRLRILNVEFYVGYKN